MIYDSLDNLDRYHFDNEKMDLARKFLLGEWSAVF